MNVLEVKDLRKGFGKREIIKGISFNVKEGEIFGFLGPNGAGKTTTIRMLVGLIKPNSGSITIMGRNLNENTQEALKNVGAVVENPELYRYLSGRENLMQIARVRNVSKEEVEDTIKLVGLENRINDKVRKYSLGMKQRLGLAAALLSSPKLLILDEPTNGLDPTGILDFRKIVKQAANERNMAVFVSSHILSEVQQLCDTVAFINNGVIKSVESIKDGEMETEFEILSLSINSNDEKQIQLVKEVLKSSPNIEKIDEEYGKYIITAKVNTSSRILKELVLKDVEVKELFIRQRGLEQRYMELVEGGIR
ncbi:ABC transporter ATP-binding protein [Clostridium cellulovorans]|uniref:ABC transporter related n=1 Tax=Clostridium cellulovorans (strain ATCC 35296 / DSM 3052 / OCM 3 / 743B) TaxID=573061 RepID=D9SMR2_CLOC7|nr:ABC transporter ATP-binding protein [Clostridium cellulovorans]ADL49847.1 ABC transporter related [Clostridium cellulovorans 743B]